ncbi:MAG: HD domain-containing protein [bacterium]|nr:HD domain-containing protein [bacterium]
MNEISLKKKLGEEVTEFFLIKDIEEKRKKTDNCPFLVLELGYPEGRIWSYVWDNTDEFLKEYNTGDIVKIRGFVEQYRDQFQIRITKIRKTVASDDITPEDLLPQFHGNMKDLEKRLNNVIERIEDRFFRELCSYLLLKGEGGIIFRKAPGGKLWHHGYIGGLLEHTVAVAELAEMIGGNYPGLNIDLLRAGALLHDIGKAQAYSVSPHIEYTDEGRLIGHIVQGYSIVENEIRNQKDFPEEHAKQLLHLILSHQGEHEKQSPVVPMTKEALILHYADEIDSGLNAFKRIIEEQKTPDRNWSNYVNLIDRFIYFRNI